MNINIQNLIKSFSAEKRKEIQEFVVANMTDEIRNATMHNEITPDVQKKLDDLIIEFLQKEYPDDLKHTIQVSKAEAENKIKELVDQKLDFLGNQQLETHEKRHNEVQDSNNQSKNDEPKEISVQKNEPFNMGHQGASVIANQQHSHNVQPSVVEAPTAQKDQDQQQTNSSNQDETAIHNQKNVNAKDTEQNEYLGENEGFDQIHDKEDRFFGIQHRIYKLLSYTDDDTAESYFRIVLIVSCIMFVLGAWNLFNGFDAISSMKFYFENKTPAYMRQIAEFCQSNLNNMPVFQKCIVDRQDSLLWIKRTGAFKDFLIAAFGAVLLFITYFLKLNYRGRDAYNENQD